MNIENTTKNKSRSFFKIVRKIFLYLILLLFLLFSSGVLLLYINKDELAGEVLLKLNEAQSGEIWFQNISIAPFAQFPHVSLSLDNVQSFEGKKEPGTAREPAILELENLYFSFNIIDLISKNINISKVTLHNGNLRITTYPDSSINLLNAIGTNHSTTPDDITAIDSVDTTDKMEELENFLAVDELIIKNVTIDSENMVSEKKSSIHIKELTASFSQRSKMNEVMLVGDLTLAYFEIKEKTIIKNKDLHLNLDIMYDGIKKLVTIEPSSLSLEGFKFGVDGSMGLSEDGQLDLNIKIADENFSILNYVIRETILSQNRKKLVRGDSYFEGHITGNTWQEVPFFDLRFGVSNGDIQIPRVGTSITDLTFEGFITSGKNLDFSEAYVSIDNLSARLPDGSTTGRFKVSNLKVPKIELKWYLKTDITGFEDVFKIDAINNLHGIIAIDAEIEGKIDLETKRILGDKSRIDATFTNVSLEFPEILTFDKIDGILSRENKNIKLEDFQVVSGNTDILLNGLVQNIVYLFLDMESEISADLNIVSNNFNLPEVFAFDPSIGRSFNHVITNLTLDLNAKTSTAKLQEFDDFPDIDFDISLLDASFTDFPDIEIYRSAINFFEDTSGFNIEFNTLNLNSARGNLKLNGNYNGSEWKPYSLISHVQTDKVHLLNLLNQFEMDLDSSSVFNQVINGSFDVKLEFPKDSLIFRTLNMTNADLVVYDLARDDTIVTNSLDVKFNQVYYNLQSDPNPMATLTTDAEIIGAGFRSNSFNIENLKFIISVNDGLYKIVPESGSLFGKKGSGALTCRPWAPEPSYHVKYSVYEFAIEDFLLWFMNKPVFSGKTSFTIDVKMMGEDWQNIAKKVNGTISGEGRDLIFYGLDLDNFLKKLERSQNFTLVDVGAVLLTGPVGLAVTKGSDLAALIATNPGDSSEIPRLVSKWNINDGNIYLDDVAFKTHKNRIAAVGILDIVQEKLNVTVAVLKKDGSVKISQSVHGTFENPQMDQIKVLESLLSPVTNLFNSVFQVESDIFYNGSVKHPE